MNVFDGIISDMLKKKKLKINPETNAVYVFTILASAGVLIENRYTVKASNEGTIVKFLATDLQWELINMLLDNQEEYMNYIFKNKD